MNDERLYFTRLTDAKLSALAIRSLIKSNPEYNSGIIIMNNNLEIINYQLFRCNLENVSLFNFIDKQFKTSATGIIAFDVTNNDIFISRSNINEKLMFECEANQVDLVDIMLFNADDWISLRQHNRLG